MSKMQRNRKAKRCNSTEIAVGLYNPKTMYVPPDHCIRGDSIASTGSTDTCTPILDSSCLALLQTTNEQFQLSKTQDFTQKKSNSLPVNESVMEESEPIEPEYMLEEYLSESDDPDEILVSAQCDERRCEEAVVNDGNEQPARRHVHPAVCCNECREDRERFENLMLRKFGNAEPVQRRRNDDSLLTGIPFNDVKELRKFDRNLKDNEQMRNQFKRKIEDIGGKNVQKTVKYSMEAVMTDELTQQVVWTLGAENVPKIFKFSFPYIIIDIVRNTFEGTKIKFIEERIADWLRRGGDRLKAAATAANKRRERLNNEEPQ